jgi:hypothetical protein
MATRSRSKNPSKRRETEVGEGMALEMVETREFDSTPREKRIWKNLKK